MTTYPFTSTGMNDLTSDLYALPDIALKAEVDTLKATPSAWIQGKFDLSSEQLNYLSGMSAEALNNIANNAALYLINRLVITLHIAEPEDEKGKWVRTSNSFSLEADNNGVFIPDGELNIYIEYR